MTTINFLVLILHYHRRVAFAPQAAVMAAALAAVGSTLPVAAVHAADSPAIPGYAAVPLIRAGNDLVIKAKINGHDMPLLLDTGAPASALSQTGYETCATPGAEANLPAALHRKGNVNGVAATVGWIADLRAGSMNFGSGPVEVTDLSSLRRERVKDGHEHASIEGILGLDILTKYGAIIDPSRLVVYFNTEPAHRARLDPLLTQSGWTGIPMRRTSHRHLSVPTRINGESFQLIVDTGAFATVVDQERLASAKVSTSQTLYAAAVINTKAHRLRSLTVKDWKIGDFTIPSFPIGVSPLPLFLINNSAPGAPMLGLLGEDVLLLYHAMIDIGGEKLYLHPY